MKNKRRKSEKRRAPRPIRTIKKRRAKAAHHNTRHILKPPTSENTHPQTHGARTPSRNRWIPTTDRTLVAEGPRRKHALHGDHTIAMFQAAHHRLHEPYRGWVLGGIGVRVQARVPSPLLVGEVQLREQRSNLNRPHAVLVAKVVELHPQTQAAVNARTHVGEGMEFWRACAGRAY